MKKIFVASTVAFAVALLVTSCAGTPWSVTASSDRTARSDKGERSDRNAQSDRGGPRGPKDSVLLGEQDVDFKVDHDTINVRNHEGSFRALYFSVEENDIELFNLVVDFGNGEKQMINSRLIFHEGSRSRLIDLNGRDRRIKSIQFTYKTVGTWRDGKAHVVVYGVK
jgi:hypothetical protein